MRTSNIHILTPVITKGIRQLGDVEPFLRPDLKVTHSILDQGPSSIESCFEEALSVPDTLKKAVEAEQAGADAIIIDCMGDPGLDACREVVSIPVLGPCQTAMHVASMLGHKFSFVTVLDRLRPLIDHLVASYGLRDNFASFESVNVPVLEIHNDLSSLTDALTEKAVKAIEESHAGAIVLGCTGFLGCAEGMVKALLEKNLNVPVIDPIPLALHVADSLVKTGLSHSKYIYPYPEKKPVSGFSVPGYGD